MLAITGTHPRAVFDLLVGLDRRAFRVVAYAASMTDRYPHFRLDTGGDEPPGPDRPEVSGPVEHPSPVVSA